MPTVPELVASNGITPLRLSTGDKTTNFAGADTFSQELSNWLPSITSADGEMMWERDGIAARSHDLLRNSGFATGAVERDINSVIGNGLKLSANPDYRVLGMTAEWARDYSKAVEGVFRNYVDDPRCFIDVKRRNSFSSLCRMGYTHRVVDGETTAPILWRPKRIGSKYATCIDLIDPIRLSQPNGMPDTDRLRFGVEMDKDGAPIAYHVQKQHPGDLHLRTWNDCTWIRIPRWTRHGRFQFLHHFDGKRSGKTRGQGLLTPVLKSMKMGDKYMSVDAQAAILGAVFAAFIESPMDGADILEMMDTEGGQTKGVSQIAQYQADRLSYMKKNPVTMSGTKIPHLYPGEKFQFTTSNRPNTGSKQFMDQVLRELAAATGLSFEQISNDWSGVNYSSARAALLEVHKTLSVRRFFFAAEFCTPIFAVVLEEAIDKGDIRLPDGINFHDHFAALTRCNWIGPGRGWVDPVKEAQGAKMRMEMGISTLRDEAAELTGRDWEETLDQKAHELSVMYEKGIRPPEGWDYEENEVDSEGNRTTQKYSSTVTSRLDLFEARMSRINERAQAKKLKN